MKRIKRTLAALLTVVLTLALLGEAVFADNSEQPVWPEEGAIQLSKSAAAVEGKENTWEVTLGIQGKNYKTTSDVVLVIDNSNSMYPSETSKEDRMTKTKAAANAFVDNSVPAAARTGKAGRQCFGFMAIPHAWVTGVVRNYNTDAPTCNSPMTQLMA